MLISQGFPSQMQILYNHSALLYPGHHHKPSGTGEHLHVFEEGVPSGHMQTLARFHSG